MRTATVGAEWDELGRRGIKVFEALCRIWRCMDVLALPAALEDAARDATNSLESASSLDASGYADAVVRAEDVVEAVRIWITER